KKKEPPPANFCKAVVNANFQSTMKQTQYKLVKYKLFALTQLKTTSHESITAQKIPVATEGKPYALRGPNDGGTNCE
ncbi:MAG TPA: hypothetical protein VF531_04340, partial [Bacillota bacterium]